jgi:MOSC domain-containing protein YiiM
MDWSATRPPKTTECSLGGAGNCRAGIDGRPGRHGPGSKRQTTLLQTEHLSVIAAFVNMPKIAPDLLRRNLVIRDINLNALENKSFYVGEVLLESTGHCHPCARMEEALAPDGYNAMRGHGGLTARVLTGGLIRVGDSVRPAM